MGGLEYLKDEGHREMIRRVWQDHYGSGSISEEEIQLIIKIGFSMMERTEFLVKEGLGTNKVEDE